MDTNKLKKFAQDARTLLIAQVTSKLGLVLAEGSAARREAGQAVRVLEAEIKATSEKQVVEKVAYTWFNRFTALRFMDANGYTNPRIVTPADGQTRPEILADAAAGHMPDDIPDQIRNAVTALLDGRTPSRDAQGEAYRLLLVAGCNQWHGPMPFLFETIADYTELLMPEDLLSETSILASLRKAMTDDDCNDVEIIGWLYQFYISEKKDQVFAGLKKNIKITAENIPAATQLFTPHWIVRYLVENSLGRLWLLNRPQSKLAAQMDYYIAPEEPETDFLRITKPEDIRICDPAAGSGHMLTYAFDLLHAIYEEEGYEPTEIPALILIHNLHGVEIDDRAGALAAFALVMKAAAKLGRRRFLRLGVQPNICVMQDVRFTQAEMQDVAAVVGRDLFTAALRETLGQFEQAKNYGSLIVPKLRDPAEVARVVRLKDFGGDLLLRDVQERVLKVLEMAEALSPKYHVVVANPPYMGSKNMSDALNLYTKKYYERSWGDLFAAFMEVGYRMARPGGAVGIINMQSWMFLSSFQSLRELLVSKCRFPSLLHLGTRAFDTISGEVVSTTAFVFEKAPPSQATQFFKLTEPVGETAKSDLFRKALLNPESKTRYAVSPAKFVELPGVQFAYWASATVRGSFQESKLSEHVSVIQGIITGNNDYFIRSWFEVDSTSINFKPHCGDVAGAHWLPYLKGGENRKWGGGHSEVLNWKKKGTDLVRARTQNASLYFKRCITWSRLSTSGFFCQLADEGFLWDVNGSIAVPHEERKALGLLGLLVSKVASAILDILAPTMSKNIESISGIPVLETALEKGQPTLGRIVTLANSDWDAYETSWDFTTLPLLAPEHRAETLAASYATLRAHWQGMTEEMQRLEEENNRIFIDAYGLQDELTPEVPLREITLTCNPAYSVGGDKTAAELEQALQTRTVEEFLHYAVGCMFGRYSLDAPGLIIANQGEGLADYLARIPEPSFDVDADNVIPVLDADWFADDITERFRKFLRVTFGEAQFQENLAFVEDALGKDIRKYFTKDFFDAHVRRYKKRPIYWMFSSPKGTFNALIYMHRYRTDTVSVVLNDYLREFISKLQSERLRLEKLADDASASQSQRTKALKDVAVVAKQLEELTAWERDVVFPLAQSKIEIDLDDGVKANYPKFGAALKPIKGLEVGDE